MHKNYPPAFFALVALSGSPNAAPTKKEKCTEPAQLRQAYVKFETGPSFAQKAIVDPGKGWAGTNEGYKSKLVIRPNAAIGFGYEFSPLLFCRTQPFTSTPFQL